MTYTIDRATENETKSASKMTTKRFAELWFNSLYTELYNCQHLVNPRGSGVNREELVWGVIIEMESIHGSGYGIEDIPTRAIEVVTSRSDKHWVFFRKFLTQEVWECWNPSTQF